MFTRSALTLLATNVGVIAFALWGDWPLATILAIYWLQSVIIGVFQALKMARLTVFSTQGVRNNGQPVDPTPQTKRSMVIFFILHYGFFHFAYAMFILGYGAIQWWDVAASGLAFFATHLYSFVSNRNRVEKTPPNIGAMMSFPYIRIVPMHVFILASALLVERGWAVGVFMVMKTIADETMHVIEHRGEGT